MSSSGKKRAVIFVHFDKDGILDPHVQFCLGELRKHCATLIFVSASILPAELEKAARICDKAISRENEGYDFVSWKVGLGLLESPESYDEITFVNDSCYGPLFDLGKVFKRADAKVCDMWGLTYSHDISPHIQSFFFSFRKKIISSLDFKGFWDSVESLDHKAEIVRKYEVGMTSYFRERGYRIFAFFDIFSMSFMERFVAAFYNGPYLHRKFTRVFRGFLRGKRVRNPMHAYWCSVLNRGVPFVKVELLRDNPLKVELPRVWHFLKKCERYDEGLARRHLERINS
ncbi:MAG: rhamnan synthesis F family protein [Spongiibacteraceae bacterium]